MPEDVDSKTMWETAVPKLGEVKSEPNAAASERSAEEDDIVRRALSMKEAKPAGYGSEASDGRLQATNPVPSGE